MRLLKPPERVMELHKKGFRVTENGVALKPDGSKQPVTLDKWGYWRFSYKFSDGAARAMLVHRLAAYQKFGKKMFEPGIEVRHMNGSQDNSAKHLLLGTSSQNSMDRPKEVRIASAARARRKLTDEQVAKLRREREAGATLPQLAAKYGLRKSTVSYIARGLTCKAE